MWRRWCVGRRREVERLLGEFGQLDDSHVRKEVNGEELVLKGQSNFANWERAR
jgi:hypothetical protein